MANPIDAITQAASQAAQTGAGKLDKTIGIGEGIANDVGLILTAGSRAVAAEGATYGAYESNLAVIDQALSVINSRGTPEQKAEANAITSSLGFTSTRANELNALANQAARNVDPTRSPGSTATGSNSANEIIKAAPGAGRQYNYAGPCPTMTTGGVDRLARNGSRCGRRAASVRPGGWWV